MTVCRRTARWPLSTIKPNKKKRTLPRPTPCRKPTNILHSLAYWPGRVKLQKKIETATIAVLFMGMHLVRSGAHLGDQHRLFAMVLRQAGLSFVSYHHCFKTLRFLNTCQGCVPSPLYQSD